MGLRLLFTMIACLGGQSDEGFVYHPRLQPARRGTFLRKLVWKQFRYGGVPPKRAAFLCAAMLGPRALHVWDITAEFARRYLRSVKPSPVKRNGLEAYLQSVYP